MSRISLGIRSTIESCIFDDDRPWLPKRDYPVDEPMVPVPDYEAAVADAPKRKVPARLDHNGYRNRVLNAMSREWLDTDVVVERARGDYRRVLFELTTMAARGEIEMRPKRGAMQAMWRRRAEVTRLQGLRRRE